MLKYESVHSKSTIDLYLNPTNESVNSKPTIDLYLIHTNIYKIWYLVELNNTKRLRLVLGFYFL